MIATALELEYFSEVYRIGHLTRTAGRLGITQPALTQSLAKLESRMGVRLFDRSRQGLKATREGELLYQHVQELSEAWNRLKSSIQDSKEELSGRFRIGCHPSVGSYSLPVLMERLRKKAPRIEIQLSHDLSRHVTDGVIQREIDLGIVVNPVKHPDLVLVRLGQDSVGYWKKKGLRQVPEVLFLNSALLQTQSILKKTKSELLAYNRVETSSLELIRTLVRSGQGIGILPERVARAEGEGLEVLESRLPTFKDEIYLAFRPELNESKAGKALLECARALF